MRYVDVQPADMAADAAVWSLANTTLQYINGGVDKPAGLTYGSGSNAVQIFDAGSTSNLHCSLSGKSADTCNLQCTLPYFENTYTFACPTGNDESVNYTNNEWVIANFEQYGCYGPGLQVVPVTANLDG